MGIRADKGSLEKSTMKPSSSAPPSKEPTRVAKAEKTNEPIRVAKTEKKIISVDSAHPPTTPMLGFAEGSKGKSAASTGRSKVPATPRVAVAPTTQGTKRKGPGALLSRKKK